MKVKAALFEPKSAPRAQLLAALEKAGLAVTRGITPGELTREQVVVFGPHVKSAAKQARQVRQQAPGAVIAAAQRSLRKPAWADSVLPLPLSPRDLKARLPELSAAAGKAVASQPQIGEMAIDPLTGFYTLPFFRDVLFVEVKRSRRYGIPLSAGLVAVDGDGGDLSADIQRRLMSGLALAVRRSLRDTDYAVQHGPGRILVLMPHTELAGGVVVSQRICERVSRATLTDGTLVLRPTVSVGVAGCAGMGGAFSFADLARHAQASLDAAIAKGGNQVEFYDSIAATVSIEDPMEAKP